MTAPTVWRDHDAYGGWADCCPQGMADRDILAVRNCNTVWSWSVETHDGTSEWSAKGFSLSRDGAKLDAERAYRHLCNGRAPDQLVTRFP